MDWTAGLSGAIEYIEENLTGEVDYAEAARRACSSPYHFQRVFSILCGCTLGEYIRGRRLTLAGNELQCADGKAAGGKIIDIALKYGYESPDSFSRAFTHFHGVSPSAARERGTQLRSFSRLHLKLTLEGGNIMDYRIEEKEARIYTGYGRRFEGAPGDRWAQEKDFWEHTRANQYLLNGLAGDVVTQYTLIKNIGDDGYDFYIAALLPDVMRERINEDCVLGAEDAKRFEMIEVPGTTYAVFETDRQPFPVKLHMELRRKVVSEWLPSSGYELAEGAEINVLHWYQKPEHEKRYIELWLPVRR